MFTNYDKAIVAFLTSLVTLLAPWVPGIETYLSPAAIAALGVLLNTGLVFLIPNRPKV